MPSARIAVWCCSLLVAACDGKLAHRLEGVASARVPVGSELNRLQIDVDFGSITVLADDTSAGEVRFDGSTLRAADTVEVLQLLAPIDLTLVPTVEGDALRLRVPSLPSQVDSNTARMVVRGVIRCPSRLHVTIRTGIGSLKVAGVTGDVDLVTGQGEVALSSCKGRANVLTGAGDILVDRHQGDLVLQAKKGSARALVHQLGGGGVRVEARSDVAVHLPRSSAFQLTARTSRGRCRNSFGVPIVVNGVSAEMRGPVAGGGAIVDLTSSAGAVTVAVSD